MMLCQMRAEGAKSDKLTLDQEHVKPLDVSIIKDHSQYTHAGETLLKGQFTP